ncbi:hypothetical protein F3087_08450 [Nocardia colli]|uniref:Uncharacterized protein n=1 Tax=Nocardia colli TaxID=2545717 RepID=A0A5N0EI88_9NOCA|nr:hypothetical protein [Nocardia colli]KAA8889012.1 hypothetical protein F3087_08450 [Nocardia colli]
MNSDPHDDGAHLAEQVAAATGANLGQRLLHARGGWATGEFTPYPPGATRWARLSWRPLRPLPTLDPVAAQAMPRDYLVTDLADRLPVRFELTAHLPDAIDEVHDPTRLWHGTQTVPLGTLTLTRSESPSAEPDFDTLRVPDGITAPQDQLSKERSKIYAAARGYRTGRLAIPSPAAG